MIPVECTICEATVLMKSVPGIHPPCLLTTPVSSLLLNLVLPLIFWREVKTTLGTTQPADEAERGPSTHQFLET